MPRENNLSRREARPRRHAASASGSRARAPSQGHSTAARSLKGERACRRRATRRSHQGHGRPPHHRPLDVLREKRGRMTGLGRSSHGTAAGPRARRRVPPPPPPSGSDREKGEERVIWGYRGAGRRPVFWLVKLPGSHRMKSDGQDRPRG